MVAARSKERRDRSNEIDDTRNPEEADEETNDAEHAG
jgi:hypothetical protein